MKLNRRKYYCACGCGQQVKHGKYGVPNKFIIGHNNIGKKAKIETKIKMSLIKKGKPLSELNKKGISKSLLGHSVSNETRYKLSLCRHSDETKKFLSQLRKGKNWRGVHSEESNKKMSLIAKSLWKNPDFVSKQMKAKNVKQNKIEIKLEKILLSLFPEQWKFVGDGKLIIDGKCPDFVNINGQKKLIELFGDYWHKDENPQDRIDIFKPFGYDTLVIWEHELKDIEKVRNRIVQFNAL